MYVFWNILILQIFSKCPTFHGTPLYTMQILLAPKQIKETEYTPAKSNRPFLASQYCRCFFSHPQCACATLPGPHWPICSSRGAKFCPSKKNFHLPHQWSSWFVPFSSRFQSSTATYHPNTRSTRILRDSCRGCARHLGTETQTLSAPAAIR